MTGSKREQERESAPHTPTAAEWMAQHQSAPEAKPPKSNRPKAYIKSLNGKHVAILAVCVAVFLYASVSLISYAVDNLRSARISDELRAEHQSALEAQPTSEATPTPAPTATVAPIIPAAAVLVNDLTPTPAANVKSYPDNPDFQVLPAVQALQKTNSDIVGWLNIPNVLDDPIVQRDNSYYLTHDYLKAKNVTGALFLDESCDLKTIPDTMVIHGHNMKSGQMFGILKKYKVKGADFLKENYLIDLESLYENAQYVIFAVLEVDTRVDQPLFLNYNGVTHFVDDHEFQAFIGKVRGMSMYHCSLDVNTSDRLLILATCTGTDDNTRLLVVARRVRENEDMMALKAALYGVTAQ